jgi:hypothetical protein
MMPFFSTAIVGLWLRESILAEWSTSGLFACVEQGEITLNRE